MPALMDRDYQRLVKAIEKSLDSLGYCMFGVSVNIPRLTTRQVDKLYTYLPQELFKHRVIITTRKDNNLSPDFILFAKDGRTLWFEYVEFIRGMIKSFHESGKLDHKSVDKTLFLSMIDDALESLRKALEAEFMIKLEVLETMDGVLATKH